MLKNKLITSLLVTIAILVGCGDKEGGKSSGQVLAKVNGEEISVHQLNFALTNTPGINKDNAEQAKKQLLDSIIDQSLIVQQAKNDKLDRDPNVMQAIENAKRQVLSQAWVSKSSQAVKKPTPEEIEKFYQEHPELFANRKVFKLKELLVIKPTAQAEQLILESKTVDELIAKFDAQKVTYQVNLTTLAAENLPLENLPALQSLGNGQFSVIKKPEEILILGVLASADQPIEKQNAAAVVEMFLVNNKRKVIVAETVKNLKEKAKIEMLGEVKVQATPVQQNDTSAITTKESAPETSINKGVQGL